MPFKNEDTAELMFYLWQPYIYSAWLLNNVTLTLQTFHMVEYEDELDLLAVVVTNGEEGEGRAHIRLHDNQSGQLLRTVDLEEPWDEVSDPT